jgi:hypothetical protein
MVAGFESYLTGYPLPEVGLYAFARTWYAPEMERPGCVWTHTLLVPVASLKSCASFPKLHELFRRPSAPSGNWELFERSVDYVTSNDQVASSIAVTQDVSRKTLAALYEEPIKPVFVSAASAILYEELVLAIWREQWSDLRTRFTFCTGAIAPRILAGRMLDLQIVPATSVREIRRLVPTAAIVETNDLAIPSASSWLDAAVAALTADSDDVVRKLMYSITVPLVLGREAFVPLVQLSLCSLPQSAFSSDNPALLLRMVGERFPSREEAQGLKAALAGANPWIARGLFGNYTERQILEALATADTAAAYDLPMLALESRAQNLWRDDPTGAEALLSFLIHSNHNTIGEALLSALIDAIDIAAAEGLFRAVPGLLVTILRRNPSRATVPSLWAESVDRQREYFDAATTGRDLPADIRARVVGSILEADSDAVADKVFRKFGPETVAMVLSWYDSRPAIATTPLKRGWLQALLNYPDAVLSWLGNKSNPSPRTLMLAATLLNPHSPAVHRSGLAVWTHAAVEACKLPDQERFTLHGFCLAMGLDLPLPDATQLVTTCFDTVHDAVSIDRIAYGIWEQWFDDILPYLSWGRNWDKCERLRRGLAERILKFEWSPIVLSRVTRRDKTFEQILNSCRDVKGGKHLLRALSKLTEEGAAEISAARRILIADST